MVSSLSPRRPKNMTLFIRRAVHLARCSHSEGMEGSSRTILLARRSESENDTHASPLLPERAHEVIVSSQQCRCSLDGRSGTSMGAVLYGSEWSKLAETSEGCSRGERACHGKLAVSAVNWVSETVARQGGRVSWGKAASQRCRGLGR
jgi:hypothetical protein